MSEYRVSARSRDGRIMIDLPRIHAVDDRAAYEEAVSVLRTLYPGVSFAITEVLCLRNA